MRKGTRCMGKIDPTVKRETYYIGVWVLLLSAVLQSVFLILGKWNYTVLLGNVLSAALAVGNFLLLGLTNGGRFGTILLGQRKPHICGGEDVGRKYEENGSLTPFGSPYAFLGRLRRGRDAGRFGIPNHHGVSRGFPHFAIGGPSFRH